LRKCSFSFPQALWIAFISPVLTGISNFFPDKAGLASILLTFFIGKTQVYK